MDLSTGFVTPIVTGMQTPHGGLFVSALSEVSVFRSDDLTFNGQNVDVAFEVERGGDISKEVEVNYVFKDLASDKSDDRQFTGSVKIPAGKSGAEFRVPITTIREIIEDGPTQEATVILQGGKGYNVAAPGATSIKLADFGG